MPIRVRIIVIASDIIALALLKNQNQKIVESACLTGWYFNDVI